MDDIRQGKTDKIKVTIEWVNDEENNSMDTTLGTLQEYSLKIPVNVIATQYLGETINEYTP